MRDSQKTKVFKAINEARLSTKELPTLKACQNYVNKCLKSKRFQKDFPFMSGRKVEVRFERAAYFTRDYLCLPKWARNTKQILSLLALVVKWNTEEREKEGTHGREFCRIYLTLFWRFIGKDDHDRLKAAFKANKVKFHKRRKAPQHILDQAAAIKQVMAAARPSGRGGTS